MSCATSSVTAANTSSGGAPRATSVATRRNAACSRASRASPARLSAFAIAIAASSVNEARRASVSSGSGVSETRGHPDHAPQAALNDNRYPDRGADPQLAGGHAALARRGGVGVDPRRTTRLEHLRRAVVAPKGHPATDQDALPGAGDDRVRAVVLVAAQVRHIDAEQPSDLVCQLCEHLVR
jgi:hypothetical protein